VTSLLVKSPHQSQRERVKPVFTGEDTFAIRSGFAGSGKGCEKAGYRAEVRADELVSFRPR
jgi:hypothetical protein